MKKIFFIAFAFFLCASAARAQNEPPFVIFQGEKKGHIDKAGKLSGKARRNLPAILNF